MPLKFDSIRAKAVKARASWDDLGKAYDALNEAIPAHVADVKAMAAEVGSMESDLQFAVNTLGNGGEQSSKASGAPVQQPPTPQAPEQPPAPPTNPAPPQAQQTASPVVGANPNFHEG